MEDISFINNIKEDITEIKTLTKLIKYAMKKEKLKNIIVSIIFVDNKEIKKLNKKYRKIDSPTDVLSFAFEDTKEIKNSKIRMLGEIYISIDKTKEQATLYEHSYLRELSFLMIHGFLHLLGYDHNNEEQEKKMFKRQEEILNGYGIKK